MRIYMDYNATSPLRRGVQRAVAHHLETNGGNPSSIHEEGRRARRALDEVRRQVAQVIGAAAGEVVLVGSATEANNLALKGWLGAAGGGHLITSAIEHPSVMETARWCADASSAVTHGLASVDGLGRVDPDELDPAACYSVMAANNEVGVLQDIPAIAEACHAHGGVLHVDAAQALGRVPVDVGAWGADLVTLSSHKAGGPSGAGALWVRPGVELAAQLHGGHQERNRRGGTENVAAAVGFGVACDVILGDFTAEATQVAALRDRLWSGVVAAVPDVVRLGHPERTLPNTLAVAFPGASGEVLLMGLDLAGVSASSGSACTAGSLEPSAAVLAMGVSDPVARSVVRFSLGHLSTEVEVDAVLRLLPEVVRRARTEVAA